MKLLVCFVPLLVLLLVQDSTEAPGPRAELGFGGINFSDFLPIPAIFHDAGSKAAASTPVVKNSTTIGGYINGHGGNNNGGQNNNTIEVKQSPDSAN